MRVGIRRSTVILPIMSVNALRFIMLSQIEWAELSFIVKHIEILIFLIIVDQISLNFLFRVSKWAVIPIRTCLNAVGEMTAKPFLIAILTIELFNTRVRFSAGISIWALLLNFDVRAKIAGVVISVSFAILCVVVVHAVFVVMSFGDVAWVQLEDVQI